MRNRIVDSTWLGRGRHVLLKQVLTCQTTSKRDPFSSTLLPLSRLFLAYSSIHTLARSSFHSLDRPLTRSLVHSHFVPPNRLFTYPHTRISGLSLARSFTPYSISPISSLSLSIYISFLLHLRTFSFPISFLFRPFQKPPHVATSYVCSRRIRMRAHARRLAHTTPTPRQRTSRSPTPAFRCAPSRVPTWPPTPANETA